MGRAFSAAAMALLLVWCAAAVPVGGYTSDKYHFSMTPPPGWKSSGAVMGAAAVFTGPVDEGFTVSLNVVVEGVPSGTTARGYAEKGVPALRLLAENFTMLSEGDRTVGGVAAYEIVFTIELYGSTVQDKQVALIKESKAYVITFSALETTYSSYIAQADASIDSFRVTGEEAKDGLGLAFLALGAVIVFAVLLVVLGVWARRRSRAPPRQEVYAVAPEQVTAPPYQEPPGQSPPWQGPPGQV